MADLYGVSHRRVLGETWFLIASVLTAVLVIGGISFGIRWAMAGPSGKLQARQAILGGANRITSYNHFFDLCASVQGLEGQRDSQLAELPKARGDDRDRILTNIAGIEGARAQAIAQYNADARKDYTIGQFRASALPYQLPTHTYKGVTTSCVA